MSNQNVVLALVASAEAEVVPAGGTTTDVKDETK